MNTLQELRELARSDPNRKVRNQAWHAATCEPCKPQGIDLLCDLDPLAATAEGLRDRSLRVRRSAATGLMFSALSPDSDTTALRVLISQVIAGETDDTIRTRALRAASILDSAGRQPC